MFKIVKDTNQSIREKCSDVDLPPSKDDIKLLKNMINYLKLSQDEKYAEKHNIDLSKNIIRLLFGGGIIKDEESLYQHKVKNGFSIQICVSPIE